MLAIISLLIWKCKTINGVYGTAQNLTSKFSLTKRQEIYTCVLMKYKIMKIRMKISFIAFEKQITIKELIYRQIIKTKQTFFKEGKIPMKLLEIYQQQPFVYEELISLKTIDCIYYLTAMIKFCKRDTQQYFYGDIRVKEILFNSKKFFEKKMSNMSVEEMIN